MWFVTSLQYLTSDFLHIWLANLPFQILSPEFLSLPRSPAYPLLLALRCSAAGAVIWSTWAIFTQIMKHLQESKQVLVRARSVGPLSLLEVMHHLGSC